MFERKSITLYKAIACAYFYLQFFSRIFLFKTFLSVLMIYYYFIFSGEHYIYIGTVFGATQQRVKKQEKKKFFFSTFG